MATAAMQDEPRTAQREMAPVRAVHKHPLAAVGAVAALFYLVYLLHAFTDGHGARSFIMLERFRLLQSHRSAILKVEPGFPYARRGWGYDGQYYYMIAVDPVNARYYMPQPSYSYQRLLYSFTARLLALGNVDLVPYTLILINLLSMIFGTVMVAAWLRRKNTSPWFALVYAGYSGAFLSFQRDLTEPMAYALMAAGIYVLDFGGKRRILLAGLLFALGTLTRDKAAILPLLFTLGYFLSNESHPLAGRLRNLIGNLPAAAFLGGMTLVPYAALKFFLYLQMHAVPLPTAQQVAPLSAVLDAHLTSASLLTDALTALAPSFICLAISIWAFVRGARDMSVIALFVLAVVTSITLNPQYFAGAVGLMRASILDVMAALYALPSIDRVTGRNRAWLYVCTAFWFSMTPALFLRFALIPWIQVLTAVLVFGSAGVFVAGVRGLRAVRRRTVSPPA